MCRCLQLSLTRDDIKLTEISIRSKPASHLLQKYQRIELLSLSLSLLLSPTLALPFARLPLFAGGVLHVPSSAIGWCVCVAQLTTITH